MALRQIPACSKSHTEMVVEHTQYKRHYSSFRSHSWGTFYVLINCDGDVVTKVKDRATGESGSIFRFQFQCTNTLDQN